MSEGKRHRCFKIPKPKLDLFLIALNMNFSDKMLRCEMEYVFVSDERGYYDVVVALCGEYLFLENKLEKFVGEL